MKPTARVYDPQGPFMQRWNNIFVMSCLISVALDSLFFYSPAIDGDNNCIYMDEKLEIIASILRFLMDIFYLLHIMFQFRTGFIAPSREIGLRVLVDGAPAIAKRYMSTYFLVDFLAVLPIPQVLYVASLGFVRLFPN
jgi:cyclic nucleotide gated channel, plant